MNSLEEMRKEFLEAIKTCSSLKELEEINRIYLGRKGCLAEFRKGVDFKSFSPEKRISFGKSFNELKKLMESKIMHPKTSMALHTCHSRPAADGFALLRWVAIKAPNKTTKAAIN